MRLMVCANCKSPLRAEIGELMFENGEVPVLVKNVPMNVCNLCGERYLAGRIGVIVSDFISDYIEQSTHLSAEIHDRIRL